MQLTNAPQLFVDFERVDNAHPSGRAKRMRGVQRVFHQPMHHPHPVLAPEKPWEQRGFTSSAIEDAGRLKMWYLTGLADGRHVTCLAESEDGVHWERPELGLHGFEGSSANNIVVPASHHEGQDHFESVLTAPLEGDPQQRFKAPGWSSHDWDGPGAGIYTATSPDGLHWTHRPDPIFRFHPRPGTDDLGPVGDAHWLMIDTLSRRYAAFLRHLPHRMVSFSEDFVHWTPPEVVIRSQHWADHLYSNSAFVYGDQYLGLLSVFDLRPERRDLTCWLISSRDAVNWERCPTEAPLLQCGGIGAWDRFICHNGGSPPVRWGDELLIYYRGAARRHGPYEGADDGGTAMGVGLARLRLDGFASLDASFDGGEVVTTPWEIAGGQLRINAKCDYGEVRVELLDEEDRPLAGYGAEDCVPVSADGGDLPVRWQEQGELPAGQTVKLRFLLRNARLYSYRCAER